MYENMVLRQINNEAGQLILKYRLLLHDIKFTIYEHYKGQYMGGGGMIH